MSGTAPRVPARLVVFDFDGTLADSFPLFLDAFDTLARRHGFRAFAHGELQAMRGLSSREMIARAGLPAWKLPAVANDFRRFMAERIAAVKLFDGIPEAVAELAGRGFRLAIATSNSDANVRSVLGDALLSRFAHVDCGISIFGKPTRLRRLARGSASGMRPIYVGDELRDAEAAAAVGFAFGAVGWGYTHLSALQAAGPEHVFAHPAELSRIA